MGLQQNYRGELNHYKQKGIISEFVYNDTSLGDGTFQCSVTIKLIGSSQEVVGEGSAKNKAGAKESAAMDAWNKIQSQGNSYRGVDNYF